MKREVSFLSENFKKNLPEIRPGMKVKVTERVFEGGKEKFSDFEGFVISVKKPKEINGVFCVRNVLDGVGVEKIYPLHSPNIKEIKILEKYKTRRGKLYFLRDLSTKKIRKKLRKKTS